MTETSIARHTPGPWTFDRSGDSRIVADRLCVALVTRGVDDPQPFDLEGPTYQANARLIAAAPDLLAAGKALLAWYERADTTQDDVASVIVRLGDAVAKAEGHS